MIRIINKETTEDCLHVTFFIDSIQKNISAALNLDEPSQSEPDYTPLLKQATKALETVFSENKIVSLIEKVATEITESAYEGELKPEELSELKDDMSFKECHFFEDDFIIVLRSPKIFLENDINVQIDYELDIQDITIDS